MKSLIKVILTTSLISTAGLGGLAAYAKEYTARVQRPLGQASIKDRANPTISQRANDAKIAEASDGDGEMNDALEAQLEEKNPRTNASTQASESDRHQKVSEDTDGGDETREIPNEPNDNDGGNETQETR